VTRAERHEEVVASAGGRSVWLWLLACTVLAAVLRGVYVGGQSLGYEELFTRGVVTSPSLGRLWHALEHTESTPPLFYLLTWGWLKLAGSTSAVALRLVSLLAGVLCVPAVFLAVRSFLGSRLAAAAALLCAVSPVLVGYSIYARSYSLLVLVAALSTWALGALLAQPSRARWGWWCLAAAACVWTHYFGAFLVVGEVGVLAWAAPGSRRALVISCGLIAAATLAPLWHLFQAQNSAGERTAFIAARPLGGRLEDVVRQFSMGTNVPSAALEGAGIALFAGACLYSLANLLGRDRRARAIGAIGAIAVGLPILLALSGVDDHLLARNLLAVWVCAGALAAIGLTRLHGAPLLLYVCLSLVTVIAVQSDWRYQASADWHGAAARLAAPAAGEPIAVIPGLELGVAGFYLRRRPLAGPLSTRDLWVAAEPVRGTRQRALGPRPVGFAQLFAPTFTPVREIDYRGFRLTELRSAAPATVGPSAGSATAGNSPPARLLAP